jgi:hypothetical protein
MGPRRRHAPWVFSPAALSAAVAAVTVGMGFGRGEGQDRVRIGKLSTNGSNFPVDVFLSSICTFWTVTSLSKKATRKNENK